MVAGLNAINSFWSIQEGREDKEKMIFPETTMIGALSKYISTPNEKFQPMNANFGIVPELGERIRDKKLKYGRLADRAIEELVKAIKSSETMLEELEQLIELIQAKYDDLLKE